MQPTKKIRAGLITAAIFEREAQGPNGFFTSKSVALQTSYKNKEGNFVNRTLSIVKSDLANVIKVLQEASEEMKAEMPSFNFPYSAEKLMQAREKEILAAQEFKEFEDLEPEAFGETD